MDDRYDLTEIPAHVFYVSGDRPNPEVPNWSGPKTVPAIGARVYARGGFGACTVVGYFVEGGWLGLHLQPDKPPRWFIKQCGSSASAMLFGAEVDWTREVA